MGRPRDRSWADGWSVGLRLDAVGHVRRPKGGGLRKLTLSTAQRHRQLDLRNRSVIDRPAHDAAKLWVVQVE